MAVSVLTLFGSLKQCSLTIPIRQQTNKAIQTRISDLGYCTRTPANRLYGGCSKLMVWTGNVSLVNKA